MKNVNLERPLEVVIKMALLSGAALNKSYFLILVPPGVIGNILSFLVSYNFYFYQTR